MRNPFEYLRVNAQNKLPEPWFDYPVLSEYSIESVYSKDGEYIQLCLGIQDDCNVVGIKTNHGGFNPGRKWGEFNSEKEAKLWILGYILTKEDIFSSSAMKAVKNQIVKIQQLNLF